VRALAFDASPPQYVNPFAMTAPELVSWIQGKQPRAIGSWNELGLEEYTRSFTAARTAGYDIIGDLYDAMVAAMSDPNATEQDFSDMILPVLLAKGWLPDKSRSEVASRVQLIYDTNLRIAQATGRWDRIQSSKAALPYLRAHTAHDERVRHPPKSRSDHRAFDDIILPVDHSFWRSYYPPLGFRCRCQVVQISRGQFARLGRPVTSDTELASRIARIGPPWGFNPGAGTIPALQRAADQTNASRLPGSAPIDANREAQAAAAFWESQVGQEAKRAVDTLLAHIFR
jgi:uncharacterized protein with gpF-like domain